MINTESIKIVKERELSFFFTIRFPPHFFLFFFLFPSPQFYYLPSSSTFLLFSLHHHHHHHHISIVFPPPPPPPPPPPLPPPPSHFYCFPSSSSSSSFLLFSLEKAKEAKIRPKRPNSNVMAWFWPLWLWRWLPHRLLKRQSLSTTTVLFRTTFTRTIKFNLLLLLVLMGTAGIISTCCWGIWT